MPDIFQIEAVDPSGKTKARAGRVHTPHGPFETPAFMPVGTKGSVKGVGPDDLRALGAGIILSNALHLMLRPGAETIASLGGLHSFMGWDGPILTDSGGFQAHSLRALRKDDPDGILLSSPYDGTRVLLTPELAIRTQSLLGSDIMMCLDECTPWPADEREAARSMGLTHAWARRSLNAWDPSKGALLFGIAQGGFHPRLRRESAQEIASMGFPGHAAGGLALGEPRDLRLGAIEATFSVLPEDKPRYLMGLGTPVDILDGIMLGADMFDCVIPTRNARNGQLFTNRGPINIGNARYANDPLPPEEGCDCLACRSFSRAYLRQLHKNREPLFPRLASVHNLRFYQRLVRMARERLKNGTLLDYYKEFLDQYAPDAAP
ncbi:MAG: tRNA guanosine(34) transglycosylase Tgt [Deltaproteobacteria bacterium]|jgi:queuine tRNA-ribosyltransferase|nr:tRNA guanosine(34) transglycosylase Tgt [Deltaproteobacteria bacterium]